jgi:hypothetical protein
MEEQKKEKCGRKKKYERKIEFERENQNKGQE